MHDLMDGFGSGRNGSRIVEIGGLQVAGRRSQFAVRRCRN